MSNKENKEEITFPKKIELDTEKMNYYCDEWFHNTIKNINIRQFKNGLFWLMTLKNDESTCRTFYGITKVQMLKELFKFLLLEEDIIESEKLELLLDLYTHKTAEYECGLISDDEMNELRKVINPIFIHQILERIDIKKDRNVITYPCAMKDCTKATSRHLCLPDGKTWCWICDECYIKEMMRYY